MHALHCYATHAAFDYTMKITLHTKHPPAHQNVVQGRERIVKFAFLKEIYEAQMAMYLMEFRDPFQ